ncbi:response regulator transcription factor [Lichenicola cladoniae]|uniref:Response regulator transcription factor n=1 Tax=Lichenicola cladoniae TaxID=1484109 RepID=A0A6M8HUF4_9PROT|nr:LytTR family DNA-binding domain-containing protein [Lichenicola cladoniae]NPD66116.1 response regulator transcription factor [Acetobacteraceae bacterium]QKE91988.1 response regulator transcription factor [Lichenicola cladoniae]
MPGDRHLRTLVVDDEPLAVERLQVLCAQLDEVELVGAASNGEAALRLIGALSPDLILLDISMPGLDGLAVARALEGRPVRPAVVFCTAFDQFAVSAFDVAASDYLLKPVELERLAKAVARVSDAAPAGARTTSSPWVAQLWVPHRAEMIRVSVAEIDRIEAERDYMRLHVGARSYLVHQTLSELEHKLDPEHFLRLHRSVIVRRAVIRRLHHDGLGAWRAALADGTQVRIGRTYLAAAKAMIGL